jgi:mycothiol synthase
VAYDATDAALFSETLLQTYQGTRDCPEVNGVRTISEILDGHSADAGANYSHWWLAFEGDRPAGVLLATESPEWESWEIAYIGIVPKARRQGLGRELMLKTLVEARVAEVQQLTVCVDSRNEPAIGLYRSLGFELYDTREVYLAVWNPLG